MIWHFEKNSNLHYTYLSIKGQHFAQTYRRPSIFADSFCKNDYFICIPLAFVTECVKVKPKINTGKYKWVVQQEGYNSHKVNKYMNQSIYKFFFAFTHLDKHTKTTLFLIYFNSITKLFFWRKIQSIQTSRKRQGVKKEDWKRRSGIGTQRSMTHVCELFF